MLYYITQYIEEIFHIPGFSLFRYISFRAAMAAVCALMLSIIFGKCLINFFNKHQIKEGIRDLGLHEQGVKAEVPTMGGIIIIAGTVIATFLFAKFKNIYIVLLLITTVWMGFIGWLDDYIKVFKKDKKGLAGKFKVAGQVVLGLVVSLVLLFNSEVVIREFGANMAIENNQLELNEVVDMPYTDIKAIKTTIPFFKNNEFDYSILLPHAASQYTWILYALAIMFILSAVSNGANLTDGLDGLTAGTAAIVGTTLAILAYVSGNVIFSKYLNIMYIPEVAEATVFITAFVASCIGFLWYNTYPAQIFMGDTGSLVVGSIIAIMAIIIRKELLIPLLCGVFLIENVSVILQVVFFKYTKYKSGIGKRIFKMAPIHHHFQILGIHEAKIVSRFWIVSVILAILTLITLKVR